MKIRKGVLATGLTAILCLTSCGVFEEPIHEHDYKRTVIPPTATEQGYTLYECSCGESYTGDFTDALESLAFEKIEGKEEYRVAGLGTVTALEIVVPETYDGLPVTEIGGGAFNGEKTPACASLTKITLPESVTEMGIGAFGGCSSLTEITLPKGIKVIPQGAFGYCAKLRRVELPQGVTEIQGFAFGVCESLTEINIPASVTFISGNAFSSSGLTAVYFEEATAWRAYSRTLHFQGEASAEQLKDPAFAASYLKYDNRVFNLYKEGNYPEIIE